MATSWPPHLASGGVIPTFNTPGSSIPLSRDHPYTQDERCMTRIRPPTTPTTQIQCAEATMEALLLVSTDSAPI